MMLTAHIKTRARTNKLAWLDENTLEISVTAIPKNGEANKAIIELIAKELGVSKSRVILVRGTTTRIKQFRIEKTPN